MDPIGTTTNPLTREAAGVLASILLFIVLCCSVLPYAGVQNDEALFTSPLYTRVGPELRMTAFHHDVPLMLMSYLGTAKTWLYAGIFHFWQPSLFSLRVPVILLGALTLWALYRLMCAVTDRLTALCACLLLATDVSFILTTTFDWGPVAIQHLTFITGLMLVVRGVRGSSAWSLGFAFMLFGLGLWDKAIFIWMLSGAAIATMVLFRSELRRALTIRNITAAVLGFVIGACPLIVYNLRHPLKTFRGNAVFIGTEVPQKFLTAEVTLAGGALFGYLVNDEWVKPAKQPRNSFENASVAIREWSGEHRSGLLVYALIAALIAVPFWWAHRKLVLFATIVMIVAWLQMAFTKDAGSGSHHVVLLWPLPHIIIAVALAGAAQRLRRGSNAAAAVVLAVLAISNLLVYNQYLCQFIRNGAGPIWSDAIEPLSDMATRWENHPLFVADWGIENGLRMLRGGHLKEVGTVDDVVSHELSDVDRSILRRMLLLRGAYFITHTPPNEVEAGTRQRLFSTAEGFGYRRQPVATINDSNGRAVFDVVEFSK